jgi:MFS family permease
VDPAGQLLVDLEDLADGAVLPIGGVRTGVLELQTVLVDPLACGLDGGDELLRPGVTIFSAASLACGLAGTIGVLIAARAVQGVGAAIVSPAVLSIITTTFQEGSERNRALGIWGAIGGSGAAAGVLFGGVLTKYAGWEWIFFVNVPVGCSCSR